MNLENLFKLQKQYESLENNEKMLQKYKDISLLKELKIKFDRNKKEFLDSKRKLEEEIKKYLKINKKSEEIKSNIEKMEYTLYNDAGSDIKLIENLQERIRQEKIQLNEVENHIISFLENEEDMEKNILKLENKISEIREEFTRVKCDQKYKFDKITNEISNIKNNIKELEKYIDEDILREFYDRREYNKIVICELKDGVCDGCKIKVSYETKSKLNKNNITHCDNCGRILFSNKIKKDEHEK
ncbi:zinc ribbon domain-containing protein [Clostridium cochlearium]|uniref:zinc ribbon domain-containing protein n=1 Tax=Clostridium cochlearium TaxID=1494 RepID=UPI000B948765|nr:C4-type zinc ribbon domain-containing protein [Clostridium cochlearium]MCR1971562.1 C4-type zinc ribbon domain-containing protein [Clostridium cochlearium]SNV84641.1 Zn-ribbon protein, possibly nucleic acid-binding [Clostridium cochlearium]STA93216.1 Zn-ribbon protein, possibly nucleic acid-binding [Clostridium cochlearium]